MSNSQWNKIINWLKRNFTLNFLVAIITIVSAWFGYDQYRRNNGGKVIPVIFSNYALDNDIKHFTLVTTGDSIVISHPQIAPFYLNCSDYPIENINVNYMVKCPINLNVAPVLDLNDGFSIRTQTFNSYNAFEWSFDYNKSVLYPNETTPHPFKAIKIYPNELKDSLFNYFDIESYIVFNGKKTDVFTSRVHITKYPGQFTSSINLDSIKPEEFTGWISGVASDLRNRISSQTDIIFAFHTYSDSTNSKGAFTHLKNIAPSDLDSLLNTPISPIFLRHHLYAFNEDTVTPNGFKWFDIAIVGFLLLASIFFGFSALKNRDYRPRAIVLFSISMLLLALSYSLSQSIIIHYNINLPYLNYSFYTLGILSTLYPFYLGLKDSIKEKPVDYILMLTLIFLFVIINYFFISKLINIM